MREIKFRGKRKYGSEWIIGDLNFIYGEVFIFDRSPESPTNSPDWFEVDPETVGQFTGLTDKNEKDIYEGDIVSYDLPSIDEADVTVDYVEAVEYSDGSFSCETTPISAIVDWDAVVIGNIHQHPELLKQPTP